MNDYMGADAVAKWLTKQGVSKEEFVREPNKWIDLALRAIRTQNGEGPDPREPQNESLFSVRNYYSISNR